MEKLKELKKDIYRCIHCKACRFAYSGEPSRKGIGEYKGILYEGMLDACPSGIEYGWESRWNAGRIWIARSVLEGDLELNEEVRDEIMPCITCGMCASQCENKVPTVEVMEALRAAIYEAGVGLIPKHQLIRNLAEKNNNPYGGAAADRCKWIQDLGEEFKDYINNPKADVAYFVGCTAAYRKQPIAISTIRVMKKLGVNFTILTDEVCCGSPFFRTGQRDMALKLAKQNLELFNKFKTVIFSCAGCFRTMTIDYKNEFGDDKVKYKTVHAVQWITEQLKAGKIKLKEKPEFKDLPVTYHDPCHLGRHIGLEIQKDLIKKSKNLFMDSRKIDQEIEKWFQIPRDLISYIPGIKFREMYRNRMDSFCCGAGGGVRSGFSDFSLKTSALRLDEAEAVGAKAILTSCPFCVTNLRDAAEKFGYDIKVYEILELINEMFQ
jgi:heterodisulfide reductase subunit D